MNLQNNITQILDDKRYLTRSMRQFHPPGSEVNLVKCKVKSFSPSGMFLSNTANIPKIHLFAGWPWV